MDCSDNRQLSQLLNDNKCDTISDEVKKIYSDNYPGSAYLPIENSLKLINELFKGNFAGYRSCNTDYHNFEHTLEVFLTASRLIDGYNSENFALNDGTARNILTAALFHDTGYLQYSWDNQGTGAKFTISHVERSVDFLKTNFAAFSLDSADVDEIGEIIRSTRLDSNLKSVSKHPDNLSHACAIMSTADLIGQMSNRAYLEKLLFLYYEYKEAGISGFDTEFDILRKTKYFYKSVMEHINEKNMDIVKYARAHFRIRYSIDRNLYIDAMEKQMNYLDRIIENESTNFRQKLNRIDLNNDIISNKNSLQTNL